MARRLRILMEGWYHVTSRGNRREALYRNEVDRRRFLGLAAQMPERFGVEVHAFVLMGKAGWRARGRKCRGEWRWAEIVGAAERPTGRTWKEIVAAV